MFIFLSVSFLSSMVSIMDWTSIIINFISSGAFISLFLITERKTAAAMKNTQSQSAEWRKLYEEEKLDNDKKDQKIAELVHEKDLLREERDLALSEKNRSLLSSARADVLRCECLSCQNRKPPLDFSKLITEENRIDEILERRGKNNNNKQDKNQ